MKNINCAICNINQTSSLFNVSRYNNSFSVVKCKNCSLIYINPQPEIKTLLDHYSQTYDYSYMHRNKESKKDKSDVSEITKLKPQKGRLLDVGCGTGLFLSAARKRGWEIFGIDVSEKAIKYGISYFRLPLTLEDLLNLASDKKYEVITMRHFLEHTTNPEVYIHKANLLLEEDGILLLELPNIKSFAAIISKQVWEWMSPPAHLFFFSSITINLLLKKYNFEILSVRTRRGDAHSLLLSFLNVFLWKIGLLSVLKTGRQKEQKKRAKKARTGKEQFLYRFINLLGVILLPLEKILDVYKKGPELVVFARKIK